MHTKEQIKNHPEITPEHIVYKARKECFHQIAAIEIVRAKDQDSEIRIERHEKISELPIRGSRIPRVLKEHTDPDLDHPFSVKVSRDFSAEEKEKITYSSYQLFVSEATDLDSIPRIWDIAVEKAKDEIEQRIGLIEVICRRNLNHQEIHDILKEWATMEHRSEAEWSSFESIVQLYTEKKQRLAEMASSGDTNSQEYQALMKEFCNDQMYLAQEINLLVYSPLFFNHVIRSDADTLDTIASERKYNCFSKARMIQMIWERVFGEKMLQGAVGFDEHQFAVLKRADGRLVSLDLTVELLEPTINPDVTGMQRSVAFEGIYKREKSQAGIETPIALNQPEHMTAFSQYMWHALYSGEMLEQKALYEEALAIVPDHPFCLYKYATVLAALGNTEEALSTFETAINLAPHQHDWPQNYFKHLFTSKGSDGIKEFLATKSDPTDEQSRLLAQAALFYESLPTFSSEPKLQNEVEALYKSAINKVVKDRSCYYHYGMFLVRIRKEYEDAEKIFFEGMGKDIHNPKDSECWKKWIYFQRRKDIRKSITFIRASADKSKDAQNSLRWSLLLDVGENSNMSHTERYAALIEALILFKTALSQYSSTTTALTISRCYSGLITLSDDPVQKKYYASEALKFAKIALEIALKQKMTDSPHRSPEDEDAARKEVHAKQEVIKNLGSFEGPFIPEEIYRIDNNVWSDSPPPPEEDFGI